MPTTWEVTMMELIEGNYKRYKVTRRIPPLNVSETKVFDSKQEAKNQFEEWLQ